MKGKSCRKVLEILLATMILVTVFAGAVSGEQKQIEDTMAISSPVVIFSENFQSGWGSWYADNGVWEVGNSTAVNCHGGSNCAATVLNGNYPGDTDSRLITPSIQLPSVSAGEEIHLRFWNWFSYSAYGQGYIQVSVYNASTGIWENWQNIGNSIVGSEFSLVID